METLTHVQALKCEEVWLSFASGYCETGGINITQTLPELGKANLLQYYDTNRILRYIVESALALNDFTQPLVMSVALDDDIPEPTGQERSDQGHLSTGEL